MRIYVSYCNFRSDYPTDIMFHSKNEAMRWARNFVRESYRNQASATVYASTSAGFESELIARYRNEDGKVVRGG